MTTFILISAAMVLAAVIMLAPSLLARTHQIKEATSDDNIKIARQRLAELETEQQKGELSDEEFAQAKQDLEIALAQDLSTADSEVKHSDNRKTSIATLVLVAALLPAIVVPMYLDLGSPQHLNVVGPGPAPVVAKPQGIQAPPEIAGLLIKLEKRLETEPNNPQGWYMLGRTYMKLERFDDAVRSFEALNKLRPEDADVMLSLADALAMVNGGSLTPRGVELLGEVLKTKPNSTTALWLSGIASAEAGNIKKAIGFWRRAYPLLADQPEMQAELAGVIRQTEQDNGIKGEALTLAKTEAAPAPAPTMAVAETPTDTTGLRVEIALDAEMFDQVSPSDTVFIYAKAANGPPMPLAVSRKTVADLPITVYLNDSMAMMPQMKLSSFEQVKVGARITKSGRPVAQTGDLQSSEIETANNSTDNLQLLINSRVQ